MAFGGYPKPYLSTFGGYPKPYPDNTAEGQPWIIGECKGGNCNKGVLTIWEYCTETNNGAVVVCYDFKDYGAVAGWPAKVAEIVKGAKDKMHTASSCMTVCIVLAFLACVMIGCILQSKTSVKCGLFIAILLCLLAALMVLYAMFTVKGLVDDETDTWKAKMCSGTDITVDFGDGFKCGIVLWSV